MHTAWLLASAMSARPFPVGSETGWRTAGSAHSRSWRTDPPPLSRSGSKSSEPTRGAISTLLEESPSLKACPPRRSGDRGCALLWWRGEYRPPIAGDPLPACTAPWSEFLPGDLYTKPRTYCRCESAHAAVLAAAKNPIELRRLLSAPGGLCATCSEVLTTVPKLAFPCILLPRRESMHPSWPPRVTLPSPGELPSWSDMGCATASKLRCSHGWPWCSNVPKSQQPLKILQLNRAALLLIFTESKHTPRYVMDSLGARMLFCMFTHSPRDSKWISSESMWLISVSRDWAKISQSSR